MNLQNQLKPIIDKLEPVIAFVRKYAAFIFVLIIAAVFGFLIWRIGVLANAEPSDTAVEDKLQAVIRPKIDQKAIDQINDLQSQNVDIKSVFSPDRSNPFQE
jgi:hypothetical protein